ncbi:MAG: protein kinase [Candidatus Acidiferrales bacterium]
MTPERRQEIKKVLAAALERAPEQRSAYLDQTCAEPEVRREVESLLLAGEQARTNFLAGSALAPTAELPVGSRLGTYEIVARIGAGGMGVVYQTRDTHLGRTVAIKVLSPAFVDDPESLSRFQREARLLASLNHPNIATIHGFEQSGGTHYLVMELIPGQTLAERLRDGPLEIAEALGLACQIAAAVENAHEQGVVHRDLKPGNIKVTPDGRVKVLDFGLAKALASAQEADLSQAVTVKDGGHEEGIVLGTPAYMSPEQARGRPVDKRTDIWSFGCVLYEMLSGHKAFDCASVAEVLAAMLAHEPDWAALPKATPAGVRTLVRRCLVKEQRQRLRDIGDARLAIEEAQSGEGDAAQAGAGLEGAARWRRAAPWALAGTTILFGALAAYFLLQPRRAGDVMRFSISAPENTSFDPSGNLSLSPDGRKLAFVTADQPGRPRELWVRSFDSLEAQPMPGTEGAILPFWSPDSRTIGFFTLDGKLEKAPISGGPPQMLCDAYDGYGGTWNADGVILFASDSKLYRVFGGGGTPTLVSAPDAGHQERLYTYPQFLPDGRHFIFYVYPQREAASGYVEAGSLDSPKTERLFESASNALYAPPGYLFYIRQGTLMAQAFDANGFKFTGPAVPVGTGVGFSGGYGFFSVSEGGALAFQTASGGFISQMAWYNSKGEQLETVGEPGPYSSPALNGTRIAVSVGEHGARDIWVYDMKRGTESRLTASSADNLNPLWSADGSRIVFTSTRGGGQYDIYEQAANGLGTAEPILVSRDQSKVVDDVAPDGRYVIYDTAGGVNSTELWVLPLTGERKPFPFVQGSFGAREARFSPNGRYVAYASNETGRHEIYVQTFPEPLGKWQISTTGGIEPTWRGDGKGLFYLNPDNKVMAVEVNTDSANFQAGIPKPLFQTQLITGYLWRNRYVVSADGQQFLMLVPTGESAAAPITVVLNWPALQEK